MLNGKSMNAAEALTVVMDIACRWGENMEEGFSERVTASTPDEELVERSENADEDLEELTEVRNLWRAIETLEAVVKQQGCEGFDPAVKDGKLTSLIDVVVFG